jgi:hypothetical protein
MTEVQFDQHIRKSITEKQVHLMFKELNPDLIKSTTVMPGVEYDEIKMEYNIDFYEDGVADITFENRTLYETGHRIKLMGNVKESTVGIDALEMLFTYEDCKVHVGFTFTNVNPVKTKCLENIPGFMFRRILTRYMNHIQDQLKI